MSDGRMQEDVQATPGFTVLRMYLKTGPVSVNSVRSQATVSLLAEPKRIEIARRATRRATGRRT